MKFFVAGLMLLTISLSALVWHRNRDAGMRPDPVRVEVPHGPERTTKCMVWKAQRGAAVLWLCGSLHTLRASDYPLPAPYLSAFGEAKRIVMELPPDYKPGAAMRKMGWLSDDRLLKDAVAPETWRVITEWTARSGIPLSSIESLKPWTAALTVAEASQKARDFDPEDGMEPWFRARLGRIPAEGLETPEGQLGLFDSLSPEAQEKMLTLTLKEEATGISRIDRMVSGWSEGDAEQLAAIIDEGFAEMPELKRQLHGDRHRAWLPRLEALLGGNETVMVLVGCGHLVGKGSLVDLLRQKGVTLTQQQYSTTRRAPESSATPQ